MAAADTHYGEFFLCGKGEYLEFKCVQISVDSLKFRMILLVVSRGLYINSPGTKTPWMAASFSFSSSGESSTES